MSQNTHGKITVKQIKTLQKLGGEAEERYKIAKEELEKMYLVIVKNSNIIEEIRKDNNFPELD